MARRLCWIPGLWHTLAAFHRGLTGACTLVTYETAECHRSLKDLPAILTPSVTKELVFLKAFFRGSTRLDTPALLPQLAPISNTQN